MYVNGVQVASGANGSFTINSPQVIGRQQHQRRRWAQTGLGEYGTGGAADRYYTGDVGEVLAYSTPLSASGRQQVESYPDVQVAGRRRTRLCLHQHPAGHHRP